MEQPVQNGEEDRPLGGGEGHQPERNHRRGQARRLAPNFRWVIPNRQVNDGSGGEGDDMEIFMEEMREIRRKLRELQLRNCLLAQVILLPWGLNSKGTRLLMEEARD